MFYITDDSWHSKAKTDSIWVDTFYFYDYSVISYVIDSWEIDVKWIDYIYRMERGEVEMESLECFLKKFVKFFWGWNIQSLF